MKKLFLISSILLLSLTSVAQKVNWMTFEQAITAQKKNNKPLFIDMYTVWCGPCKMLDQNTFSDPKVAKILNEKYNPVKFNAEGNETIQFQGKKYVNQNYNPDRATKRNGVHDFAMFIGIRAYPTMIVLGNDGKVAKNILGYHTPEQMIQEL